MTVLHPCFKAALDAATRFASTIISRPSHDRHRPGLVDGLRLE
jgi:hypothetical protein